MVVKPFRINKRKPLMFFDVLAPNSKHLEFRKPVRVLDRQWAYDYSARLTQAGNMVVVKTYMNGSVFTQTFQPRAQAIAMKGIGRVPHPLIAA